VRVASARRGANQSVCGDKPRKAGRLLPQAPPDAPCLRCQPNSFACIAASRGGCGSSRPTSALARGPRARRARGGAGREWRGGLFLAAGGRAPARARRPSAARAHPREPGPALRHEGREHGRRGMSARVNQTARSALDCGSLLPLLGASPAGVGGVKLCFVSEASHARQRRGVAGRGDCDGSRAAAVQGAAHPPECGRGLKTQSQNHDERATSETIPARGRS